MGPSTHSVMMTIINPMSVMMIVIPVTSALEIMVGLK